MSKQSRCVVFVRAAVAAVVVVASVALATGSVPAPGVDRSVPPAAAQSAEVTGVDVASWQHPTGQPIDWGAVRAAGHSFAVIKATEGAASPGGGRYTNPWFNQDWVGAGAAGLYRGAYHYAQPTADPADAVADARHFIAATGTMRGAADLPPVLDLEEHNGLSPAQVTAWTASWLAETQRLTGRESIIYTGPWFWNTYVRSTAFTGYRLWIASYTSAPGPGPLPCGWPAWTIWQWTSQGTVPGIIGPVDMNRFCCSLGSLADLAAGGGQQVGNPFGALDAARRLPGGTVEVAGWAIDPDTVNPIRVHNYVGGPYAAGGTFAGSAEASVNRNDVGRAFPQYGPRHGYSMRGSGGTPGSEVCLYAINQGPGTRNTLLGCRVPTSNPLGSIDAVLIPGANVVQLAGWAADPDSGDPIEVQVLSNGRPVGAWRADRTRNDVARAFPGASANHGYDLTATLDPGPQELCVVARNVGSGTDTPLGCRWVSVPGTSPVGNLDLVRAVRGGVEVAGWAIDPDAPGPVQVTFTVNGIAAGTADTGLTRNDVTRRYPFAAQPGYSSVLSLVGSGSRQVCATAVNANAGVSQVLGCRSVTLGGEPFGNVDLVAQEGGGVRVVGWALDPDTAGPIDVHLYVDDGWGGSHRADVIRPDIAIAYPAFGFPHGFDVVLNGLAPGTRRVCAYGINTGSADTNPLLACRNVTVTPPG